MALVKWNPFIDLISLQERMSELFDEALSRQQTCSGLSMGAWAPMVDIFESEKSITLTAELPGVVIDNVTVEVNEDILTLSGERKFEKNLDKEHYLTMERIYGSFQRVFSLPAPIDKKGVKASFKDGILTVTLPKVSTSKAKHIKVKTD